MEGAAIFVPALEAALVTTERSDLWRFKLEGKEMYDDDL